MDPITTIAVSAICQRLLSAAIAKTTPAVLSWLALDSQMPMVNRCYNKVRDELADVGLLYEYVDDNDAGYLDQIELEVGLLPSYFGEAGFVFEKVPWLYSIVGFREGVIYLPSDLPSDVYVPGGTLTDVIRHEYAHTWHWLEPEFFETGWFERTFGGKYDDNEVMPAAIWQMDKYESRAFSRELDRCRSNREREALLRRHIHQDFVSPYAGTKFCEDFAETFMYFLRYRKCLDRFKPRAGVYRKLKAVEKAVSRARSELGMPRS